MSDLNSMYSNLRNLKNYKNSCNELKQYLASAYNNLVNSCDLTGKFVIDDVVADNGELARVRDKILSAHDALASEITQVQRKINIQENEIRTEEMLQEASTGGM